jgi:hypothetical protein
MHAGASSLEDVFPAALQAALWRALLEANAIAMPDDIEPARVEVRQIGPDRIELVVPSRHGTPAIAIVRLFDSAPATYGIDQRVRTAASTLAQALEYAQPGTAYDYDLNTDTG